MIYVPLVVPCFDVFLRMVRFIVHVQEIIFKAVYNDSWNPQKTSRLAKK